MNELLNIWTQTRLLAASILLVVVGCLQTGCSDQKKYEQMMDMAQRFGADITIQTPTKAKLGFGITGTEAYVMAGSEGVITVKGATDREKWIPIPSSAKQPTRPNEPLMACRFANGVCDMVTVTFCISQEGAVVVGATCPQE